MSISPPNYTQFPNDILDKMPVMKDAEWRVACAICRKTFGWHKREDLLSLSQLMKLTGLSRQGVLNGLEQAIEHGYIGRTKAGQSYKYRLVIEGDEEPASQPSRPVEAQTGQRSRLELVNVVDTQQILVNIVPAKELGGPVAQPNPQAKQQRKPENPLSKHPAIQAFRAVTGRYPREANYAQLVEVLGECPDVENLRGCWVDWNSRGFNPQNIAWAIDWYLNGHDKKGANNNGRTNGEGANSGGGIASRVGAVVSNYRIADASVVPPNRRRPRGIGAAVLGKGAGDGPTQD
jgi:phage replication O-like protein O